MELALSVCSSRLRPMASFPVAKKKGSGGYEFGLLFMLERQMKYDAKVRGLEILIRKGRFIPACLLSLLLWIIASLPGKDLQRIQTWPENELLAFILSDPFMHVLTFGVLTLLICLAFSRGSARPTPFIKVAAIACGYSLLIEVYQYILPWRGLGWMTSPGMPWELPLRWPWSGGN